MAAQPKPPAAEPDDLEAVARSLNWELVRLHRLRVWKLAGMAVLSVSFIVVTIVFGFYIYGAHEVAQCVNRYAQANAAVQRARAEATIEANQALSQLVGQSIHAGSHAEYVADVHRYQAAVQKVINLPIPPLPPAGCR